MCDHFAVLILIQDPTEQCVHRYHNQTGVEIRPYQFGNLSGIAALDPSLSSVSGTYEKLISALIDAGYEEGHTLFGAPYDFRLAADGLEQVIIPTLTDGDSWLCMFP